MANLINLFSNNSFTPRSISGLIGWYDFSDATTLFTDTARTTAVSADGDSVKGVSDKSGSGNHMTEATAPPVYKTGIKNSLSISRFTAASNHQLNTAAYGAAKAQPYTFFVVLQFTTLPAASGNFPTIAGAQEGSATQALWLALDSSGFKWRMNAGTGVNAATGPSATTWYVTQAEFNGASSNAWVNGTQVLTTVNANTNTLTGFQFGDDKDSTAKAELNGDIAEALVYNAVLSTSQQASVKSYLASKWAIAVA